MWYIKSEKNLYLELDSNKNGLSTEAVIYRLKQNGKNIFPKQQKQNIFKIIFSQFKNSIIIILLVAIFFSLIIGEYSNACFIGIVVIINTIIGTFQEYNAEKSAEKLQSMIKVNCTVLRDGIKTVVDSEDLVVGDIVFLEIGNKVPADIRIIDLKELVVDESILTGESNGILKNNNVYEQIEEKITYDNMLYAGTLVKSGRATGIIVETGLKTELGKIANKVIHMDDELSPLVVRIDKFSKQICSIFITMVLVLSIILYIKGYMIKEIFFSVVALTVSAIPEGLSTAMTISLSLSSKRMAKKNVIVKKLSAVESLGSCTVIASDKTGTLTVNEQTAKVIKMPFMDKISISGVGYNDEGIINYENDSLVEERINLLIKLGVINNEAEFFKTDNKWNYSGDSIDVAFLALGSKKQINKSNLDYKIISRIPYESEKKYSATYYLENKKNYLTIKGSTEKILDFCSKMISLNGIKKIDKEKIIKESEELAKEGYRVIAMCYKLEDKLIVDEVNEKDFSEMIFVGLVGFVDPVRDDAISSIEECRKAGIKVYMITGDHPLTAFNIAKELNIVKDINDVTTGEELEEKYKEGEVLFDDFVSQIRVCARVSPLQKLLIVESLKRQDEYVAVTGDGVNDAPALKSANIGVAMGSGTDLAKETGDMIIIDDKFSSIVKGIEEGRIAYNNIRSVIYMLLSTGLSEVILYVLAIIFNLPFPLIAIQFLWLNLITNGIESNAMAFEKSGKNVMKEKLKDKKEQFFNKLFVEETLLSAVTIAIIAFGMYFVLYNVMNLDITLVRTYLLVFLVFAEDIHVFNCRNEYISAFKTPFKNNYFVVSTIFLSIIIQSTIIYIPVIRNFFNLVSIPFIHIILLMMLTFPLIFIMEAFKNYKSENS